MKIDTLFKNKQTNKKKKNNTHNKENYMVLGI